MDCCWSHLVFKSLKHHSYLPLQYGFDIKSLDCCWSHLVFQSLKHHSNLPLQYGSKVWTVVNPILPFSFSLWNIIHVCLCNMDLILSQTGQHHLLRHFLHAQVGARLLRLCSLYLSLSLSFSLFLVNTVSGLNHLWKRLYAYLSLMLSFWLPVSVSVAFLLFW